MTQIPSKSAPKPVIRDPASTVDKSQFESRALAANGVAASSQQRQSVEVLVPDTPEQSKETQQEQNGSGWLRWGLRTKATALAIALGTFPIVAVGLTAINISNRLATAQIVQTKQATTLDVSEEIGFLMREFYGDIQVLAGLDVFTDSEVRETVSLEGQQAALDRYIEAHPQYDSIAVFETNGDLIVQDSKNAPLPNHSDRAYFQEALKTERPVISQPLISASSGTFSVYTAAPIRDKETGETIAIIRARIPMDFVHDTIGEEGGQEDYYLISQAGEVFAGPEGTYTVRQNSAGQTVSEGDQELEPVMAESLFPDYARLKATDQPEVIFTADQILAYSPVEELEDVPNLGWRLLATVDQAVAFAPQRQLLKALILGTGVTALLVAAIAAYIANRATRPLLMAADAVNKIGQGDLDTRLEVQGDDEIAALGANINQMARRLGGLVQEQISSTQGAQFLAQLAGSYTSATKDLDTIFELTVQGARELLNADRVFVYELNPDWSGIIVSESVLPPWPIALNASVHDSYFAEEYGEKYRQGRIQVVNDIYHSGLTDCHIEQLERFAVKANLVVPIIHNEKLFGLLVAQHCAAPYDWPSSEIEFFRQLAIQLGLVMDRALLLQETEKLAEEQRQLKETLQRRALELLQEIDPISQGDLTIRAKVTPDEIGTIADSYNATVDNLRKIVTQVQAAASQVSETTQSNEVAVQTLSQEALRQAEEIAAALEQVESMAKAVQEVVANAEQAERAVQQAAQTVEVGDRAMNQTVDGIQAIRATVAETSKKVKRLGESSQKISTIVDLINGFAEQTRMLSLNASIEAALAGEQGRGFAAVAAEVRALAQRSTAAAEEIKQLVAGIQKETNDVVVTMEAGTEQVVMGTKRVDESRRSLNQITAVSREISQLVEAIAQATVLQSRASATVTQTMIDVAAIADQTSAEANQISVSFQQLRKVAQTLQENVSQFKVN